jgi:hypothetical protein
MFVHVRPRKCQSELCQNLCQIPPKPRANTVIYGDTPTHIDVEESR